MPASPTQIGASAPATFVERLANQVGLRVGATTIVGTPIERDGVTVVPMARASCGFGGGSGSGGEGQQRGEGTGGGGGANVRPVGYIEIKNGQATFRPIVDPNTMLQVALMFAGTFAVLAGLRAVRRILAGK
jgi:uncharacterized spore protein YtfJ